ncbi:MAG: type II toxin-antitoxin system VapC family toxin [Microcystaceae cyanobacterium]
MIYLDSHIVVWLYTDLTDRLSNLAKFLINENELYISQIVRLELQYLYEIGRIREASDTIIEDMSNRIDLKACNKSLDLIINQSLNINWTRDPFDRLIVGNASIDQNILLTKDRTILANYQNSRWQ